MGLLDWLRGRRRGGDEAPPRRQGASRPELLPGQDENSPQVMLKHGETVIVMDREQYQYLYGECPGTDPAQADLDELLPRATRVRALAAGLYRGKPLGGEVILDTRSPEALDALGALPGLLRIEEAPATFGHCACLGGPTLELSEGEEVLALLGLHHGQSVRWERWKHDARLTDGPGLCEWLVRHGVEPAMLEALLRNDYDAGGMMPLGFRRRSPVPLSRAEQRLRLAELRRVRGGDPDEVLAAVQREIDADPKLALGYAVRAFLRGQRGDQAGCVADCSEAIRLGLQDAELYFTRAVSRDALGEPEQALVDCSTALEINPDYVEAYNSRGFLRSRLGRADEALADFGEAIKRSPEWALPYLNRGNAHRERGDLEAAVADYDRALGLLGREVNRGQPQLAVAAHLNRAQAYRLKGDEARAAADSREAERLMHDLQGRGG